MRKVSYILSGVVIAAGIAHADQGWQDNQDGNQFWCRDVQSVGIGIDPQQSGATFQDSDPAATNTIVKTAQATYFDTHAPPIAALSGTSSGGNLQRQVSVIRDGTLPSGVSRGMTIEGYSSIGSGQGAVISAMAARGTRAAPTAARAGSAISQFESRVYDGTSWLTTIRQTTYDPPGTVGTGNYPTTFSAQVNAAGVSGVISLDSEVTFEYDTGFNVVTGQKDLAATSSTGDSLWFPVVNGIPTGVPAIIDTTAQGSRVAFKVDPNDSRAYFYNGAWQPWAQYTGGHGTGCLQTDNSGVWSVVSCSSGSFYQTWTDLTFTPLPQETFSTAGAGLSIADDPGDAATVISLPILLSPGSCTNCSATFDNFGRATAYSSGTAPVTSVTGSNGVACSPSSPSPNCTLATFACSSGQFANGASSGSGLTCATPTDTGITQLTHDVLAGPGSGGQSANVVGIEDDAICRGDLLFANEAAPATPSAGDTRVYVDNGTKNIAAKNDAGIVNHGAQTFTCSAHQFETALADTGASTCAQPAFSDVSGSVTCAQLPALTGVVSTSAGFCATSVATDNTSIDISGANKLETTAFSHDTSAPAGSTALAVIGMTDGSAADWTTTGHAGFVAGQPIVAVAGNGLTTNAIKNFARTSSIQYNLPDLTSASTNCSIFPGAVPGGTFCNPDGNDTEFSKGFAAGFCRITAYFTSNTWATPTVDFQAQVTRNGSNVTGCITPVKTAGTTGLVDSGEISVASTAATDTWGVHVGSHYASGLASIWINVEIYQ